MSFEICELLHTIESDSKNGQWRLSRAQYIKFKLILHFTREFGSIQAFLLCLFSHSSVYGANSIKLYDVFNSHGNTIFHVGFHLLQTINLLQQKRWNIHTRRIFQLKANIFAACVHANMNETENRWWNLCTHIQEVISVRTAQKSIKTLTKLMKCLQMCDSAASGVWRVLSWAAFFRNMNVSHIKRVERFSSAPEIGFCLKIACHLVDNS